MILNTLKGLALLTLIVFLITLSYLALDVRKLVLETTLLAQDTRVAANEQIARLRDPKNAKALDAAIQTAAVFNASGKLVNTQVIPRAMQTLDDLDRSAKSLASLIQSTDRSINQEIVPRALPILDQSAVSLSALNSSLTDIGDRTSRTLEAVNALIADPGWKGSISELHSSLSHIDEVTEQLSRASLAAPTVAASVEKISVTSAKYRKAMILVTILSTISRAFF